MQVAAGRADLSGGRDVSGGTPTPGHARRTMTGKLLSCTSFALGSLSSTFQQNRADSGAVYDVPA
jgi:hypothetical protein